VNISDPRFLRIREIEKIFQEEKSKGHEAWVAPRLRISMNETDTSGRIS
jgi:hypothetical protein